jgi:2-haloacid dehalogenase
LGYSGDAVAPTRRDFIRTAGAATTFGVLSAGVVSAMQESKRSRKLSAMAFDAYGTLLDVFSVTSVCERLFPGNGNALAQLWRAKQLQYTLLRSMMNRYKDFWQLTNDGLVYAAKSLKLPMSDENRRQLMDAYLALRAFPDVRPGLEALKNRGVRLAILSNGEPKMLKAEVESAGIAPLIDRIISVHELRVYKPNPRVYRLVSQKLQVASTRVGFVSSNSWDINGAASAGLYTFWIQRNAAEPPEELGYSAKHVVGAITDLDRLLP